MKQKLNIKLNELNARELDRTEKQMVKGGEGEPRCCQCGCCYEGEPGGSDKQNNLDANFETFLHSPCPPQTPSSCAIKTNNGEPYSWDHCSVIV